MAIDYEILGRVLSKIRIKAKFTQIEVAQRTGINNTTLCLHEKGQRHISLTTISKLLKLYNVSYIHLFTLYEEELKNEGDCLRTSQIHR